MKKSETLSLTIDGLIKAKTPGALRLAQDAILDISEQLAPSESDSDYKNDMLWLAQAFVQRANTQVALSVKDAAIAHLNDALLILRILGM